MNLALRIFAAANVTKFVTKSAGIPGELRYRETLRFADLLGERLAYFTNLDWDGIDRPDWGKREAERLEQAMKEGASGIKIFKALGLGVRLANGKLLRIDDPRLEPLWQRAAKTGAIVAWHVADHVAFFKPVDKNNERYEELSMAPDWSFYGKDYPSFEELIAQRDKVLRQHPNVTFLGIHFGCYPENLEYTDQLLSKQPNFYIDVAARLGEIGRHPPEKLRAFFIKHQDRILFGTDIIVSPEGMQLGSVSAKEPTFQDALEFYQAHRRFFESSQRQINHPTPIQGRWKINAINLPPTVLAKVYRENAERLIFNKRREWLKAHASERKENSSTHSP
jgi:predicted TIM-barrel fold metal-dependent hydrolase